MFLAETGPTAQSFESAGKLASWVAVCQGQQESAGVFSSESETQTLAITLGNPKPRVEQARPSFDYSHVCRREGNGFTELWQSERRSERGAEVRRSDSVLKHRAARLLNRILYARALSAFELEDLDVRLARLDHLQSKKQ